MIEEPKESTRKEDLKEEIKDKLDTEANLNRKEDITDMMTEKIMNTKEMIDTLRIKILKEEDIDKVKFLHIFR